MSVPILHVPGLERSNGQSFNLVNLFGESTKTKKMSEELGFKSMVQFLSPHRMVGEIAATEEGQLILDAVERKFHVYGLLGGLVRKHNSCPKADKCTESCLAVYAGHLRFRDCQLYEFAKTLMFLADSVWYTKRLLEEVLHLAFSQALRLAVRLNGGSDIRWEKYLVDSGKNMFELSDTEWVQYYDYTKVPSRMFEYLDGHMGFPKNYHLTFSRGSDNWDTCLDVLDKGGNVAVVTRNTPRCGHDWFDHPEGGRCEIIDGDQHDFRFLDNSGVFPSAPMGSASDMKRGNIVVLTPKGTEAKEDTSGFVLDTLHDLDGYPVGY